MSEKEHGGLIWLDSSQSQRLRSSSPTLAHVKQGRPVDLSGFLVSLKETPEDSLQVQ